MQIYIHEVSHMLLFLSICLSDSDRMCVACVLDVCLLVCVLRDVACVHLCMRVVCV